MPDNEIMPNKTYFVNRFYRFFISFIAFSRIMRYNYCDIFFGG